MGYKVEQVLVFVEVIRLLTEVFYAHLLVLYAACQQSEHIRELIKGKLDAAQTQASPAAMR